MEWIKVSDKAPPEKTLILLAWNNYDPNECGPVTQTGYWDGYDFLLFEVGCFKTLPRLVMPTHYALIPPLSEGRSWYINEEHHVIYPGRG